MSRLSKFSLNSRHDLSIGLSNSLPRKSNLLDAINIREILDSLFHQNDCSVKPKPPLTESDFMNHILSFSLDADSRFYLLQS